MLVATSWQQEYVTIYRCCQVPHASKSATPDKPPEIFGSGTTLAFSKYSSACERNGQAIPAALYRRGQSEYVTGFARRPVRAEHSSTTR